jgi:hypothetical protein
MARFLRLCTWLLALGPGLLATVQAECSQDCATCSYRLVRPGDINFLVSVSHGERVATIVRRQPQPAMRLVCHAGSEALRRKPLVIQVSWLF